MDYHLKEAGIITILCLFLFSCHEKKERYSIHHPPKESNSFKVIKAADANGDLYIDSNSVLMAGERFLLQIQKIKESNVEGGVVTVSFFEKINGTWNEKNRFPRIELMTDFFQPSLKDMNGDNVADLLLSIGSGTRGGNEFFIIFFIDPKKRQLVRAKGIENIVNPGYDAVANTIFSMSLYGKGALFTDFTILNGDSLAVLQTSDLWVENGKTFQKKEKYNKAGKMMSISIDSIPDGGESCFSPW